MMIFVLSFLGFTVWLTCEDEDLPAVGKIPQALQISVVNFEQSMIQRLLKLDIFLT